MYRPVLPSGVLEERPENDYDFNYQASVFDNKYLRVGVVTDVIELGSEGNIFGMGPEYEVMCLEQNKDGTNSSILYRNCVRFDSFGGVSDFMFAKMRKPNDPQKVKSSASTKDQQGSIVLLLCLDGSSEKAVIVSSLPHPNSPKLKEDLGHHLEGEFNGLNWKVDKDGALTITFKSATDNEGKPQDDAAGGSFATITKEGSIELNDGNTEKILIDKTAKTIDMEAEKDISVTTKANLNVETEESINLTAKKDLIAMAEGKAAFTIKSMLDIKADAPMKVMAPQLQIDAASGMVIMGSQVMIQAPIVSLGPSPAPALISNTQFQGIGNLGAPVISVPMGPFSKSVQIST